MSSQREKHAAAADDPIDQVVFPGSADDFDRLRFAFAQSGHDIRVFKSRHSPITVMFRRSERAVAERICRAVMGPPAPAPQTPPLNVDPREAPFTRRRLPGWWLRYIIAAQPIVATGLLFVLSPGWVTGALLLGATIVVLLLATAPSRLAAASSRRPR